MHIMLCILGDLHTMLSTSRSASVKPARHSHTATKFLLQNLRPSLILCFYTVVFCQRIIAAYALYLPSIVANTCVRHRAGADGARMAGERAGSFQITYMPNWSHGLGCGATRTRVAEIDPCRDFATAIGHWRTPAAEARIGPALAGPAGCHYPAATYPSRPCLQNVGIRYESPAVDSRQEQRRCALDCRTDPKKRVVWCCDFMAKQRPLRIIAQIKSRRPEHGHVVLAHATDVGGE